MNRRSHPTAAACALMLSAAVAAAHESLQFNRDIRPILSDNCFACHGPDKNRRESGLRLDIREQATNPAESGDTAIVPGQPEASELIVRILSEDRDEQMPPPKAHKKLTAAQKEVIKRWIREGAEYEPHWAFAPPVGVPPSGGLFGVPASAGPPQGGTTNKPAEAGTPSAVIDAFIRARLDKEQLAPSPEADKATLIRRVSLDLTGLPPTPEEVDAFVDESHRSNETHESYEQLVDRLLASPHYGERMAVDWLDAARFADTNGYQVDRDREMYAWRDWVIRAFNDNQPFDQFTVEQIAGDLLPGATFAQRIATGFHRNHMINEESGLIDEEFLAEYCADRVETTAAVWLGQTFNCTRCHDHKFDPFTQRDFYSMKAFFHNVTEQGEGKFGANFRRSSPPFAKLPAPELEAKLAALHPELAAAQRRLREVAASFQPSQAEWERRLRETPVAWSPVELARARAGKVVAEVDAETHRAHLPALEPGAHPFVVEAVLPLAGATALRLEWTTPGQAAFELARLRILRGGENAKDKQPLQLRAAETEYSVPAAELAKSFDPSGKTKAALSAKDGQPIVALLELEGARDGSLRIEFEVTTAAKTGPLAVRIAATEAAPELLAPAAVRVIAAKEPANRTAAERKQLEDFHAAKQPEHRTIAGRIAALTEQIKETDLQIPVTLVMEEMAKPRPTHILMRGAYDKPGEQVTANTPAALPPMAADLPRNRLGLARWLVDPRNPLPARVTVNRLWQMIFGTGLVKTSEDFGAQGEPPSHPELLDWLAVRFKEGWRPAVHTDGEDAIAPWDVKAMMRLLVTSATYRQSSRLTPTLRERDPENRLLARGPRFRLPAEFVRDQALAVSGLLVKKIGGPSVRPYHPAGLYEQVVSPFGRQTYEQGKGGDLHRRSLYTYWKRSVPHPAMLAFDAPFREACTLRRPRTNTPLQALNLMNDPTYVEAARFLAQRMMSEGGASTEARLTRGFRLVLARAPHAPEVAVLTKIYERSLREFRADAKSAQQLLQIGEARHDPKLDSAELAALATAASALLCMDAAITKE